MPASAIAQRPGKTGHCDAMLGEVGSGTQTHGQQAGRGAADSPVINGGNA